VYKRQAIARARAGAHAGAEGVAAAESAIARAKAGARAGAAACAAAVAASVGAHADSAMASDSDAEEEGDSSRSRPLNTAVTDTMQHSAGRDSARRLITLHRELNDETFVCLESTLGHGALGYNSDGGNDTGR